MGVRVGRDVAVAVGIGSGVALAVAVGSGSGVAVGGGADNAAQARLTAEKRTIKNFVGERLVFMLYSFFLINGRCGNVGASIAIWCKGDVVQPRCPAGIDLPHFYPGAIPGLRWVEHDSSGKQSDIATSVLPLLVLSN